jgi:hypothetical protein
MRSAHGIQTTQLDTDVHFASSGLLDEIGAHARSGPSLM